MGGGVSLGSSPNQAIEQVLLLFPRRDLAGIDKLSSFTSGHRTRSI